MFHSVQPTELCARPVVVLLGVGLLHLRRYISSQPLVRRFIPFYSHSSLKVPWRFRRAWPDAWSAQLSEGEANMPPLCGALYWELNFKCMEYPYRAYDMYGDIFPIGNTLIEVQYGLKCETFHQPTATPASHLHKNQSIALI